MAWKNTRGMATITRKTVTIDATDKVVGRLATSIANLLLGKDQPGYTPHIDTGAIVKVTNADKLVYTGKKMDQKC
jgi:large subunit ribosomal protein L13